MARGSSKLGKRLLDLRDAGCPGVAQLVARGVRVGVARLPEALDEGVALVVLLQREEGRALVLGQDRRDLREPLPVLRRERLDGAPAPSDAVAAGEAAASRERQDGEEPGGEVSRASPQDHPESKMRKRCRPGPAGPGIARAVESRAVRGAYLDHNATTPLDPRCGRRCCPGWVRPGAIRRRSTASDRRRARRSRRRGDRWRRSGRASPEVVFTASGTEANNAVLFVGPRRGPRSATSSSRRSSTRRSAARRRGWAGAASAELTGVPPGGDGVVSSRGVRRGPAARHAARCLMLANNELGTLQPVAEVARACRERGVPVLCDAVQAVGKIAVDVAELGVDYLTVGAHKFHGPLGAAALWVRARRAVRAVPGRRQPGAAAAGVDGERAGDRRLRRGLRRLAARRRSRSASAPRGAARPLRGRARGDSGRDRPLRRRAAAAEHLARRLPRRRRPGARDPPRPRGLRGLDRLGLRLGHGRAEPDAARDGDLAARRRSPRCGSASASPTPATRSTPSCRSWRARWPRSARTAASRRAARRLAMSDIDCPDRRRS